MQEELKQRQELERRIVTRAFEDEGFKKQLLEDPKAAIAGELGLEVPESVNIHVQEEDARNFYLTIPLNPDSVELGDELLEAVAGGEELDGSQEQGRVC